LDAAFKAASIPIPSVRNDRRGAVPPPTSGSFPPLPLVRELNAFITSCLNKHLLKRAFKSNAGKEAFFPSGFKFSSMAFKDTEHAEPRWLFFVELRLSAVSDCSLCVKLFFFFTTLPLSEAID
jgi:hypothetical protein